MSKILPQKCLITGGCGFLGSNIASSYLRQGVEVVVIDALFRTGGAQNLAWLQQQAAEGQFHFYQCDLADHEAVNVVFREHGPFDYICHLGGQVAMTTSLADPRRDLRTNVVGTFNVLEAARAFSPESLVAYSSTNKVYGDLENLRYGETSSRYTLIDFPHGLDESTQLDFASPYGCSKGAADSYVKDWYRNFGLKTVAFRHSSIYGGRQFSTFDQGWIGWFCKQAIEQSHAQNRSEAVVPFTIAGTGKQVRDVLHATDLIALYESAYAHKETVAGQVFNIGGGGENSLSLLELFEHLESLLSMKCPLVFQKLPKRQSDQMVFIANIQKAESILGWKPSVSAREGLVKMLEWSNTSSE
jgi:CDP-paratose 2-epimerase